MGSELRAFVFAISFIIIFAGLFASVPTDLQGSGGTVTVVTPLDPTLVSDFQEAENWTRTDFVVIVQTTYTYTIGGYTFLCEFATDSFSVGAKVWFGGIIWLGQLDYVEFISPTGENQGTTISFDEIEADATDGVVRYTLQFYETGNSAGSFIFYWNTTIYSDPSDAWDADALVLVHGFGFDDTAVLNIASLIIGLLFFQLPDVPPLINLLIATPLWASVIFIMWFIFVKSTPFLG